MILCLWRGMGRGANFSVVKPSYIGYKINRLNINRGRGKSLQAYLLDWILNVVQMIFSGGRLDLTSAAGTVLTVCCSVWAALLSWPPLAVTAILLLVDMSYVSICIRFYTNLPYSFIIASLGDGSIREKYVTLYINGVFISPKSAWLSVYDISNNPLSHLIHLIKESV